LSSFVYTNPLEIFAVMCSVQMKSTQLKLHITWTCSRYNWKLTSPGLYPGRIESVHENCYRAQSQPITR